MNARYARDQACRDGSGFRMPALAQALNLLADDEDFAEEILRKVTSVHKQPEENARRRERVGVESTLPSRGSALRDNRI